MSEWASRLWDYPYNAHGWCLLWDPFLLSWTILGHGMTALAYLIIPLQLGWLLYRSQRGSKIVVSREPWILTMFAAFIALCGLSHVLELVTLRWPIYLISTGEVVLTGIVSLATAGLLGLAVRTE
jgi:hypothetical protein